MPSKLIQTDVFPPGEFPYEQIWQGKTYSWPGNGLSVQQQASNVLKFRLANGLPRATLSETIEDIDVFTCQRLGNDPHWCSDGTRTFKMPRPAKQSGCAGCGAKLM